MAGKGRSVGSLTVAQAVAIELQKKKGSFIPREGPPDMLRDYAPESNKQVAPLAVRAAAILMSMRACLLPGPTGSLNPPRMSCATWLPSQSAMIEEEAFEWPF